MLLQLNSFVRNTYTNDVQYVAYETSINKVTNARSGYGIRVAALSWTNVINHGKQLPE